VGKGQDTAESGPFKAVFEPIPFEKIGIRPE